MSEALQDLLDDFSPEVQHIVRIARERIRELVLQAREDVVRGYNAITYDFGSTKDQFAMLVLHRAYVNLQFSRGAELLDPVGILEGTGKTMRHVKLRDAALVLSEAVGELLESAVARART